MSRFVELHLLQNVPPANLNRDDTGTPKDCEFGGHRRGRVSSQSLKRAIRFHNAMRSVTGASPSHRTKRIMGQIVERLVGMGRDQKVSEKVVELVLTEAGFSLKEGVSSILFFINDAGLDRIANHLQDSFDNLAKKTAKDIPAETLAFLVNTIAEETDSPDLALFGRMIAVESKKALGKKNLRIDAACQVAHAISTNRLNMDEDFFTAVDDFSPEEKTGAGMMGVVDFNSSCYYRYSVVNIDLLIDNLHGDRDLAKRTVEAYLRASVESLPSGKQNTFAARVRPDFIMTVVRDDQPLSLANAFEKPVTAFGEQRSLTDNSIAALAKQWTDLNRVYGSKGVKASNWVTVREVDPEGLGNKLTSLDDLISSTLASVFGKGG